MKKSAYTKKKIVVFTSVFLLLVASYLFITKELKVNGNKTNLIFESFNIKNISTVQVAFKNGNIMSTNEEIINYKEEFSSNQGENNQIELPNIEKISLGPKWQLPTHSGYITSYPNYYHVAYDITSSNGTNETVYPIADGVVSGIYSDTAGALIVTMYHNIDGVNYTSQYVHLSSYAQGLYVGKALTKNDPLGQMGRTGIATGVHLHVTVVDNCILFDPNDINCKDLNSFFRYTRLRYNEGFTGLNNLLNVPQQW